MASHRGHGEGKWQAILVRRWRCTFDTADGFDRAGRLPCAVQRKREGHAVLSKPFGVIGDNLASSLEPPHGQAVKVGLTTGP